MKNAFAGFDFLDSLSKQTVAPKGRESKALQSARIAYLRKGAFRNPQERSPAERFGHQKGKREREAGNSLPARVL